jgi:hypothetical protein
MNPSGSRPEHFCGYWKKYVIKCWFVVTSKSLHNSELRIRIQDARYLRIRTLGKYKRLPLHFRSRLGEPRNITAWVRPRRNRPVGECRNSELSTGKELWFCEKEKNCSHFSIYFANFLCCYFVLSDICRHRAAFCVAFITMCWRNIPPPVYACE